MFTNILAPVDGSQHSIRAALTAVDIAEKYKARVTLHVINVNQFTGLGSLQAPPNHRGGGGQPAEASNTIIDDTLKALPPTQVEIDRDRMGHA